MNNNEDTYKIFHGLKPVKRNRRKEGQSEYYYLDPRGADRFADFKEIDVESEDSPNPKITAILRDDLKKNERDYYIWHTRKDEKVRDRHKEREGKIFNWHVPPEGGHPGEDYNCRCWAEPYRADMAEQFNITPKFDLSSLPQYAENDKAEIKSDAALDKNNAILTEDKFRDIITFLRKDDIEGFANFPYLDSVGKDTVCTGHLITDKEQYSLPYYMADTGKPATKEEIKKEFDKLHQYTEYQKHAKGKDVLRHTFFENVTKLRLTDAQCDAIDRKIIEAKWDELVEQFPNFTIMDWNLQRAIFDVHYQCDVLKKKKSIDINWNSKDEFKEYKWPKLLNAAENKNIPKMAEHVHVIQSSSERNNAKINWVLNGRFY